MYQLLYQTPVDWFDAVSADFDTFLLDHAACERKASGMAMSMVAHYPDREEIVRQMTDLAVEELQHFKAVMRHILARSLIMRPDEKDEYVNALHKSMRKGSEAYLLDRLIVASLVEARGYERFQLVADGLPPGALKTFYQGIAQSEQRHFHQFLKLAQLYYPYDKVRERLDQLLPVEAEVIAGLPFTARLH